MRTNSQWLASVVMVLILGACSTEHHPTAAFSAATQGITAGACPRILPEIHGHFSHQEVVELVTSIRHTSSERILLIEEDHLGDINVYTGEESGEMAYLFRREKGRLVGCGSGLWEGSLAKQQNLGVGYDLDRSN